MSLKYHVDSSKIFAKGTSVGADLFQRLPGHSIPDLHLFVDTRRWGPAVYQPHQDVLNPDLRLTEGYQRLPLEEEEAALTAALRAWAEKRKAIPFVKRMYTHDRLLSPRAMLAGLFPDGSGGWEYLTYSNPRYRRFMSDLMVRLIDKDCDPKAVLRMAVDWSKITPFTNELFSDPNSRIPREHCLNRNETSQFVKIAWSYFWGAFRRSDADYSIKKFTSPGADMTDSVGTIALRDDMVWHRDAPALQYIARYDFSAFKKSLLEDPGPYNSITLCEKQLSLDWTTGITPGNIGKLVEDRLVNQSAYLERYTSLDPALSLTQLWCKNRGFTILQNGLLVTATIRQDRLSQHWETQDPTKKGPCCRVRFANAMAQNKLYNYMLFYRGLTEELEASSHGFPSLRKCVMDRINRFCTLHPSTDWDIRIFEGDRTASDKTITSNPDLLLDLYDPDLRDWRHKVYGRTIFTSHDGPRVAPFAQASGHPGTTFDTHLPGMMEATHLFGRWFVEKFADSTLLSVEKCVLDSFYDLSCEYCELTPYVHLCATLVSDDIKWWVAVRRDHVTGNTWDFSAALQAHIAARFMDAKFVQHSFNFGMHGSAAGVELNANLCIQRMWNGEGLGLSVKDGSSTYEKWAALPLDIALEVDGIFYYHFHVHMDAYQVFEKDYDVYLALLGLSRLDLTNQYSVTQMNIYRAYIESRLRRGLWVPKNPLGTTKIDPRVKERGRRVIETGLASKSTIYRSVMG